MPALGLALGLPFGVPASGFTGLLDDYATDIVECWCPARRLLSSWTGAAATLRETSGSTTQDIGYDADGYFDTAAATTFINGAAATFRKVYGQKGTADLNQTSTSLQPDYVSSHAAFNNRVSLHLSALTMGMDSAMTVAKPYSILVIEDDDGTPDTLRTITAYTGASTFENNLIAAGRSGLSCYCSNVVSTTSTAAVCVEVLTAPASGDFTFYCNSSDITTASAAAIDWQKLAVGQAPGGSEGAKTQIAAVIVFNKELSAAEVAAISTLLAPGSL